MSVDQARAIAHDLDQLPDDLDPAVLEQAEKHLVAEAGDNAPRELRILGRKVLEVLDPEAADPSVVW